MRPLLKDKQGQELYDFIAAQLAQREPFYEKAQLTFDVDVLDSFDKINGLVKHITEVLIAYDHGKMEN